MPPDAASFYLLLDPLCPPAGDGATRRVPMDALEVPEGVSFLTLDTGGRPTLDEDAPGKGAFAIEPVMDGAAPRLLLVGPGAVVNGQPAPRLALLDVRDQVALDACPYLLHVTRLHPPSVGPVPPALVGRKCPICRAPFQAGDSVYTCWACGTSVHHSSPASEGGAEEGGGCFESLKACPACGHELIVDEGFTYVPEA
ncbi:MAG: hypothetical protein FJ290_25725 [Planctomycetes bacterium]|nr:hypothetical protein [Planctomycetota bacterium]